MAKTAGHVTMLQRSPTYVISRPDTDRGQSEGWEEYFLRKLAYGLTRWKNVSLQALLFQLSRRFPSLSKRRSSQVGAPLAR